MKEVFLKLEKRPKLMWTLLFVTYVLFSFALNLRGYLLERINSVPPGSGSKFDRDLLTLLLMLVAGRLLVRRFNQDRPQLIAGTKK